MLYKLLVNPLTDRSLEPGEPVSPTDNTSTDIVALTPLSVSHRLIPPLLLFDSMRKFIDLSEELLDGEHGSGANRRVAVASFADEPQL